MSDKSNENTVLRQLGVRPKGQSGCATCDAAGLIQCKCTKKGGGGGAGGDSSSSQDKKENNFSYSLANKTNEHHDNRLELKLIFGFFGKTPDSTIEEREIYPHLQLLKSEFDEFIEELKQRGISTEDLTAEIKNSQLHITIPNAKLHDEFILRLIDKKLFDPNQNALKDDDVQSFRPSPFSMRMKPPGFR